MANGKAGPPLGNQNNRKGKPFLSMLNRLLTEDDLTKPEGKRRLMRAGNKLLNLAAAGEEWAIKELANRLDGKAIQGVAMVNPDGTAAQSLLSPSTLRGLDPAEADQLIALLTKAGAALPADEDQEE